jgi:hypothetical protein
MKKILLLMMCCPMILSAQNGVTVSNLDVKPGTVTFNVGWNDNQPEGFLWSDSVWVFVDYNKNGVMTRLPITSATATAGTVEKISGNSKGVRVIGNARSAGNFSATVHLLTDIIDVAGACAYASNYPPVGEYIDATQIKFTGTPPYDLVLTSAESGTYTYSINAGYYQLYAGETMLSFTDKTGAPGFIVDPSKAAPPGAASPSTWTFASRTWSSALVVAPANCNPIAGWSDNAIAEYLVTNGDYYYDWQCLQAAAAELCPDPWRLPGDNDLTVLAALGDLDAIKAAWPAKGFMHRGGATPTFDFSFFTRSVQDGNPPLFYVNWKEVSRYSDYIKSILMQAICVK